MASLAQGSYEDAKALPQNNQRNARVYNFECFIRCLFHKML